MYDPIMRVFTVLEILQARDRVTGAELAERLEVDLRTVQRYILRLKDLGIPIDSSAGVGGAYRLRPGYRLPPLMLTNEEAFALSIGLQAMRKIGLHAFAPATEGARAKLERVLPQRLRESVRITEEVIAIEPSPWVISTSIESLTDAATAVRNGRRVRFEYRSHTNVVSRRELEPYAVLHTDDRWYLIGNDVERQAMRTFRLDRVQHLELCDAHFERPPEWDAKQYLSERMPFLQSNYQVDVSIDMPFEEARKHFMLWRIATEPEENGTRLRCGRDQLEIFAAMLLSTGCRIVVHNPPELRDTFRRLGEDALRTAESVATPEALHRTVK